MFFAATLINIAKTAVTIAVYRALASGIAALTALFGQAALQKIDWRLPDTVRCLQSQLLGVAASCRSTTVRYLTSSRQRQKVFCSRLKTFLLCVSAARLQTKR